MSPIVTERAPGSGPQRYLEIAIPLVAFGVTLAGVLLWQAGLQISFQFFAAGCLIGSCILAYLAWIRPHKDIVALSTPIYAFIFFVVPTDYSAGLILQLLYAASLTLLLVRLKYRFGSSAPVPGETVPEGPLGEYCARVADSFRGQDPAPAEEAAMAFVRFAEGDFESAERIALMAGDVAGGASAGRGACARAFAIMAEQARSRAGTLEEFRRFAPEDAPLLFHPGIGSDPEQEYMIALDNALLLLYSCGLTCPEGALKNALVQLRPFAMKLSKAQNNE